MALSGDPEGNEGGREESLWPVSGDHVPGREGDRGREGDNPMAHVTCSALGRRQPHQDDT